MSIVFSIFFIVVVTGLGVWGAWMTGRAAALTWQPYVMAALYFVPLAGVARFLHHALTGDPILSLKGYMIDFLLVCVVGSVAYHVTRASRMTRQYPWLYERTGPFTWREKAHD